MVTFKATLPFRKDKHEEWASKYSRVIINITWGEESCCSTGKEYFLIVKKYKYLFDEIATYKNFK